MTKKLSGPISDFSMSQIVDQKPGWLQNLMELQNQRNDSILFVCYIYVYLSIYIYT